MQFIDVRIREAQRDYKRDEGVPWPVLVDDLAKLARGNNSRQLGAHGGSYIRDRRRRSSGLLQHVAHPPTLKQAIDELVARGGRGAAAEGVDSTPHLLASIVGGWHGVSRGGQRGLLEYTITPPGGAVVTYVGHLAKPALAPIALRATPLPTRARVALAAGGAVLLTLIVWAIAAGIS